jgi:hypothetical protein
VYGSGLVSVGQKAMEQTFLARGRGKMMPWSRDGCQVELVPGCPLLFLPMATRSKRTVPHTSFLTLRTVPYRMGRTVPHSS